MTNEESRKARKPKDINLWDGGAECVTEEFDDKGGGAFGVNIHAFIYDSKNVKRLIEWLPKALAWIEAKELK